MHTVLLKRDWVAFSNTYILHYNNSASKGGGLYLESTAQLCLQNVKDKLYPHEDKLNTSIYFTSTSAQYGSADYIADETYFDLCSGDHSTVNSTVTSSLCMKQFSFW